tara:strand:+ start:2352 stop:3218 length:867 start_codon:yes stop_codon:yes gene_type:complete
MNHFSILSDKHLKELNEEGVIILPNLISKDVIDEIKEDTLSWCKKISFNNRISSLIIGSNQWIEHLGLCSSKGLQVALDEGLINFLKDYFKSDPSIGSISMQKKIFPENGIPLHSDLGDGLSIFIYLTEPDERFGITEFIKKSQLKEINEDFTIKNKVDDATYLDLNLSPFSEKDILKTHGGIGTVVIFHRAIWHQLPKFSYPGREILMIQYFKENSPAKDHLIKSSFLNLLSPMQTKVLLKNASNKKLPSLAELGTNPNALGVYKIPDWKMLLYFCKYKLFSKAKIR